MPTKTLAITNLQGNQLTSATIDTDILFPIPENTPTCPTIVSNAISDGTLESFLERYSLVDSINDPSRTSKDMKKNIQSFYTDLNQVDADKLQRMNEKNNFSEIINYLKDVNKRIPILNYVDSCLSESVRPDLSVLEKQKEITDESKQRLESIKAPEQKVSYYEGWFPLFRPMTEAALFGVFAAGAVLLLLSIAVFLRLTGIEFKITLPATMLFPSTTSYNSSSTGGLALKSLLLIGVGLGIGLALGVYGYNQGWFDTILPQSMKKQQ